MLHAVFPAAKVVLIRRDKEDCLRSFVKTFGKGPGINRMMPQRAARRKVRRELQGDIRREEWAAGQPWVRKVEFEEFLRQPGAAVDELSPWLELRLDFEQEGFNTPSFERKQVHIGRRLSWSVLLFADG